MIERFNSFIESKSLFIDGDKLLLAASGGADSMALFHLLRAVDIEFSVAHVNYSLRDTESTEDAIWLKDICEKYQVPFFEKTISNDYWKEGMNIQKEAREIRYSFFQELVEKYHFTKILTAHHKDDVVETVLMNLTRGTGISGLKGIQVINENIVRPLLFAEKEELLSYLSMEGHAWREDSSNSTTKYKRNRFRHDIIPLLKEENPAFNEAIERLIENVMSVEEVYLEAYQDFTAAAIRNDGEQIKIEKSDPIRLRRFLFEYLKDFSFNRSQVNDVLRSLASIGKNVESESHFLFIDRNELILLKKEVQESPELEIVENASALLHPIKLIFSSSRKFQKVKDENIGQFDKEKLTFPLKIRPWKEGDRMRPLGMKGNKKVSDILIDKKISQADKRSVYVLLSKDEIIWIPGIQMSETAKVDPTTSIIWKAEQST
jgi:tRNA(Ile)-lysidine synthase